MKFGLILALISAATFQVRGDELQRPDSPEIVEALQLRARLGVADQLSEYAVFVRSVASHHFVEDYTRVATRSAAGEWTVISVGERRSGLVHVETAVLPLEQRTLGREEGERLYRLLRRTDLFVQTPSAGRREVAVGAPIHTMEIVTPSRRTIFRWTGRLEGPGGQVADIVMGQDPPD